MNAVNIMGTTSWSHPATLETDVDVAKYDFYFFLSIIIKLYVGIRHKLFLWGSLFDLMVPTHFCIQFSLLVPKKIFLMVQLNLLAFSQCPNKYNLFSKSFYERQTH